MNFCARFVMVLLLVFSFFLWDAKADYSDVSESYKFKKTIDFIASENIASGYPDGTFRPDYLINRAEFTKIVVLATKNFDFSQNYSCFKDIEKDVWYTPYICSAKKAGLVSGYNDNTFRPSEFINFVEALKIVAIAMKYQYAQSDPWYKGIVKAAETQNTIPLTIDSFGKKLTRGEMADMMARFILVDRGKLETFLGDKYLFKVTYSSIENNLLIEKEWINYLSTSQISNANPYLFAENIRLPQNPNKIYRGDGKYELTNGDQVFLKNGITVEINSITKFEDSFLILVNYYLNNERINFLPVPLKEITTQYGAEIKVETERLLEADPRFFKMQLSSIGNPLSTKDLYDGCIAEGTDKLECMKYVIFSSLPDENIKTEGAYRVIYPKNEEAMADYFLGQMKYCLQEVIKDTSLSPKIGIVPLKIFYDKTSKTVTTSRNGIFWPIDPDEKSTVIQNADSCIDPIVIHELTHFLILPAYLQEILNESFAFYTEKNVTERLYSQKTKVLANELTLKQNESWENFDGHLNLTFLGVSQDHDNIAIFSVKDLKNRFAKLIFAVGLNTAVSLESFTKDAINPVIYLKNIDPNPPFFATIEVLNSPPISEYLICGNLNFELISGWQSPNNGYLKSFLIDEYNYQNNTQPSKVLNYLPLSKYLTPDYPWIDTYLNFYASGACFWREYLKKDSNGLRKAFEVVNEFRNKLASSKEEFTLKLLERLGEEFKKLAQQKGL